MSTTESSATPPSASSRTIARIALRNTVWVTLGSYLNQLIGFAATLILTRSLSAEIFGYFSLAAFWFSVLNVRPKAGLNYAAIQHTPTDGKLLGTYYVLDQLTSALNLLLCGVAAIVFAARGYAIEMVVLIVALPLADTLNSLLSPLGIVLEKELQLSRITLVAMFTSTVAYGTAIALAWLGAGLWSLVVINFIIAILSLGGAYWVCKRRCPEIFTWRWQFERALVKPLLQKGLATGLSLTALGTIVLQYDNYLIGTFVSVETLGFYDRAYRIANWPNILLSMVIARVGFLTFNKVKDDPLRLTHAVRLSLWMLTTLGLPMVLMLFFGASDLVDVLYGSKWHESAIFLPYLTLYSFSWPFVSLALWLAVALGRTRFVTFSTIAQIISLVALATPLTWQWGALGTVAGVLATMAFAFVVNCMFIFRQAPLSFAQTFGSPCLATLVGALVLLALPHWNGWGELAPFTRLLLMGCLGVGAFFISLLVLQPTETRERLQYLRQTWHKP
jgi:O-antigen/teichoic acid export membrane protein